MGVVRIEERPEVFGEEFDPKRYLFVRLEEAGEVYGHGALAEIGDCLELHLELSAWGPGVARRLRGDVAWVRAYARSLGKRRIVGAKTSRGLEDFDHGWGRFARMFGFTGYRVTQWAHLEV